MTNYEKWLAYTDGLPSPDNFRKWGWYYLVNASLQRRVWCPPDHDRLYPNIYPILVGEPGIGKGGIITTVTSILNQFKLKDFKVNGSINNSDISSDEKLVAESILQSDLKKAQGEVKSSEKSVLDDALVLPCGGNAVTYEALVQAMAQSYRRINYVHFSDKDQKNVMGTYGHSSMHFCLQELGSLFKKHTESLMTFLNEAYDCAEDYRYKTKTQGEDRIRRVCLSLLAGTVPEFMQSVFDEKLVNSGFSSRAFFIFALKNRKTVFFRPELTVEQREIGKEITDHIRKLTHLYGQVQIGDKTKQFLQEWKENDDANPHLRASKSPKLKPYYSRKNIHVMKVAMARHFGESNDMEIPLATFEAAIEDLYEEEKTMALALMFGGSNPLAKPAKKLENYLRDVGEKNFKELLAEFWEEGLRKTELEEVLLYLQQVDKVTTVQKEDELTKQTYIYYKSK